MAVPLMNESQRLTLTAFCDTIVPAVEHEPDPDGFWARRASDLGIPAGVEQLVLGIPEDTVREGLLALLDALTAQGLPTAPSQPSREQLLRNLVLASPDAAAGVNALSSITLFLYYGAPDPATGINPNWATFGYRGPAAPPPEVPKRIDPLVPEGDDFVLEADACVVGSGAGGGVIAATLAASGLKVVVLEAGGYFNESDFAQLELKAYQEMYWRGGPTPTADGNISLQAGTTLGGGTTINWTNCLRTKPWVREQWASEFGLEGVDGPEFDAHLDAVLERIGANDTCSHLNDPQQRLKEGCDALGWNFKTVVRNTDAASYSPDSAAYMGFGDQSGSKQSGEKTFLLDAHSAGADVVVRCRAERVLVDGGRAVGVEAAYSREDGVQSKVTIHAPRVVVACGALESPALLQRSGIGGPAVGQYLRLHPCTAVFGSYEREQQAWWGAPQAGLCDEFANTGEGHGYLIETTQYAPALVGSAVAWTSGQGHKEMMSEVGHGVSFIGLTRDRGHGHVAVDASGEAAPFYSITDELDLKNLRLGLESQIRLHHAAGAREIYSLAGGLPRWGVGDDLDAFVAKAQRQPMRAGGQRLFSAHQLGSCRMGRDPATSVAGPWGQLHDVQGVWIGDGSAFPTASGTNPMVSIMALARRTGQAIAGTTDSARPLETASTG